MRRRLPARGRHRARAAGAARPAAVLAVGDHSAGSRESTALFGAVGPAMAATERPLTMREALERLKGVCGRSWLRNHLDSVPEFGGGPTHRRIGKKIVFLPADWLRLLESLPTC